MPTPRRSPCAFAFALATFVAPGLALAAPTEELPLSNEAAMAGGTVLAGGRSAGSFWYNPAVLGRIHLTETEASAEVLGLRRLRAPGGVALELPGGDAASADLESDQFVAVPTTFAGAQALTPKLTLGFGLFQPVATELSVRAELRDEDSEHGDTRSTLRHRQTTERYYAGLGLGAEISPNFQLGASVFFAFDQTQRDQRLHLVRSGSAAGALSSVINEDAAVASYGLMSSVGLRGRLGRMVHGAVSVRTPTIVLGQSIEGTRTESHLGPTEVEPEGIDTQVTPADAQLWEQSQLTGWHLAAGLTVGEGPWQVGLDVHADTGTTEREGPLATRPTYGARLGAMVDVSESVSLGMGLFHERSEDAARVFGATRTSQWGGSLGVEIRRRLEMRNRGDIEFRTVVAAWYAYGSGSLAGVQMTSTPERALATVTAADVPMRQHLLLVHIGSALAF